MRWFLFIVTIIMIIVQCFGSEEPKKLNLTFEFTHMAGSYCSGASRSFGLFNQTLYDWCMIESKSLNLETKSLSIQDYYDQVNFNHRKHVDIIDKLKSRVPRSKINVTVISKQHLDYLEITGQSGHLFLINRNSTIDDKIHLDPSISPILWNNYKILNNIINEIQILNSSCESIQPIIENQIVWLNQSVSINGSCCMIANVTLAPGQQLITTDLTVEKTDESVYLDGEFTWGFIYRNETEQNISTQLTFDNTFRANCVDVKTLNLETAVTVDYTSSLAGNFKFNYLELENVVIDNEDNVTNSFSLLATIPINEKETFELCLLDFLQVNLTTLSNTSISGVNLSHLLTVDTNQTLNVTIKISEIQVDGSQLKSQHQWTKKMSDKFKRIIESEKFIYYNNLTFNRIDVTNLISNDLDYLIFNNLNESYQLNKVSFSGPVGFANHVNGLDWQNDLVHLDEWENIDSKLIIIDELVISDTLASNKFPSMPMDNWVIEGDFHLNGHLNDRHWIKMIDKLVKYDKKTDLLNFDESVEASDCHFDSINRFDTSHLTMTSNITDQLKFKDLAVNNLILNEVNVQSCLLHDKIVPDEFEPIDQLDIINVELNGTINGIEPTHFLVNGSGQDFTGFGASLMLSNVAFNNIVTLNESTDIVTPQINGLTLDRVLRADPNQKWPETVILTSCNITHLTNLWLDKSLKNLLFNHSSQTIEAPVILESVTFTDKMTFSNSSSVINFKVGFGNQGDVNWDKITVVGDLTARNIFDSSILTHLTLKKGFNMTQDLKVNKSIDSSSGDIYDDSIWKVHRPSTISSALNLTVDKLQIEDHLTIKNDHLLPWLTNGSLDGIEYYHEVILDHLTTNFKCNLTANQMELESILIKLDDIIDSSSGHFSGLQFIDGVTIKENFTSSSNVDMNLVKIHV